MQPALRDGDVLLVRGARSGRPGQDRARPGALVVVRLPGGRPLAVKRLGHVEADGGLWVERDNPAEGVDSWQVGAIPPSGLAGVAVLRVWPRPGRPTRRGQA